MKRLNRNHLSVVLGLLGMMAALFGCSTLPEPQSETDTVFVLPVKMIRSGEGGATFGYYEIVLSRPDDKNFRRQINIYAGSGNEVVAGLEPGLYVISSVEFRYKESKESGEYYELGIPFVLEPKAITLSPATIVVLVERRDPDSRYLYMGLDIIETSETVREEVLDELREYESFSKWRVLDREEALGG